MADRPPACRVRSSLPTADAEVRSLADAVLVGVGDHGEAPVTRGQHELGGVVGVRGAVGRLPPHRSGLGHAHHVGAPRVERIVGARLVPRLDAAAARGHVASGRDRPYAVALLVHPLRSPAVRLPERHVPHLAARRVHPHQPAVPAAARARRNVTGEDVAAAVRGVEVVRMRRAGAVRDRRRGGAVPVHEADAELRLLLAPAAGAEHRVSRRVGARQHPERLEQRGREEALPDDVEVMVQLHHEAAPRVHDERAEFVLRRRAVADRDDRPVGVQRDALDGVPSRRGIGPHGQHVAVAGQPQQHAVLPHHPGAHVPGAGDQEAAFGLLQHEVAQIDAPRPVRPSEALRAALVGAHDEDAAVGVAGGLADDHEAAVARPHRRVRVLLGLPSAVADDPLDLRSGSGRAGAIRDDDSAGGQQQPEHDQALAATRAYHVEAHSPFSLTDNSCRQYGRCLPGGGGGARQRV